ncbi:hypothetical protein BDK61_2969 [Haloarcula quadrata]|uniref:Uncharacterized protein n=1 Tax=Haloarcula quadrata TaxID=182779 RepID=A0A495R8H2_9EURY|nr:hypothetical protein [Haloarcula quadrata]RKS83581.1 hypothetical protein BDK61_2969 [Haloarcula quadrata]
MTTQTAATGNSSSDIQWNSSDNLSREIGDTSHNPKTVVRERDAYEISEYSGQRDYDGDASHGSRFDRGDIPQQKQEKWRRLWMLNEGANPSYEDGDGLESQISNPSDTTGRRAHQDKLETVERIGAKFEVPSATINEARTLASAVDATGHSLEKVAIGAIVVANDRHIAEKVRRSDVDSAVADVFEGSLSDAETNTALNLLEDAETLPKLFQRRLKGRSDVQSYVEDCDFTVQSAMGVFYDD